MASVGCEISCHLRLSYIFVLIVYTTDAHYVCIRLHMYVERHAYILYAYGSRLT